MPPAFPDSLPSVVIGAIAYAVRRGRCARTYLLPGRDTDAIIDVIARLAAMEALPSEGLLFSLD